MAEHNKDAMMPAWELCWYNAKVAKAIDAWPAGILADFRNIAGLMLEHGPNIGMPHTRAMGGGLFEVRAKGREGIGRAVLHRGRAPHRDPARLYQENRTDTRA